MEKPAAVKVQYSDDIRRFSLSTRSFEGLRSVILEAYPELKDSRDWKLKYKDEEGDFITITCDFELAEALNQSLLRIYVVNESPSKPTVAKDFVEKEPSPPAPFELDEPAQESAAPPTSPAPQSGPLAFDLATLLPLFQGLQSPPSSSSDTAQPTPFDLKPFLQLLNELQQNQHMMNVLPQIMSTLPQLLSDPTLMNLLSTTMQSCPTMVPQLLSVAQQNPAILQALPQLINTVARNPALLNMLPIFLATFAPQGQQPQPSQPQQQQQPSFVQPQPCFYTPQPQPPQPQTPQPQPPQQAQQPTYQSSYQPQQWTCSPPAWQQPEFLPQPQSFPLRFFQPTPQVDPSPPIFSFMPDHGESCPSFTFGQGLSSSSLSSSFSSSSSSSTMPEFFPWQTELQQLESMGFTNVEANKAILRKNNGDMVATVQDLTGAGL